MNDKKTMEIEIITDISKAKNPIDKLISKIENAGKVAKAFNNQKVILNTSEAQLRISQLKKEIRTLKNEANYVDLSSGSTFLFREYASAIADAERELQQLENSLDKVDKKQNDVNKRTTIFGNAMKNAMDTASSRARKFVYSLFGIQTAWRMISKATTTYLSYDTKLQNRITALWTALGSMIAPIVEKIVVLMAKAVGYINVFVKALTGVDFISKAITKSMGATNKTIQKTLSSMDEITNLDLDQGDTSDVGGVGSALEDLLNVKLNPEIVSFLEKLAEKLKKVKKWMDENNISAGKLLAAFGIVFGIAKIGKWISNLAKLIGIGGTATAVGSGLAGVATILGIIAGMAVLTIEIKTVGDIIKKISEYEKKVDDLEVKQLAILSSTYQTAMINAENAKTEEERNEYLQIANDKYDEIKDKLGKTNANLDVTLEKTKGLGENYDNTKTVAENLNKVLESGTNELGKQKATVGELQTEVDKYQTKLGNFLTNIGNKITEILKKTFSYKNILKSTLRYIGINIPLFASGGYPQQGQMFVARESGPEMVGTIGGQTAVVNNDQIVQAVSIGVAQAVSSVIGNSKSSNKATYLYLNGSEFAKAIYGDMENENNRRSKSTSIRRV